MFFLLIIQLNIKLFRLFIGVMLAVNLLLRVLNYFFDLTGILELEILLCPCTRTLAECR